MAVPYVVVLAHTDPVAQRVAETWGTLPATGLHVEGAALRALPNGALVLARPGPHVHDDRLEERLPAEVRAADPTLVFPSIHRSDSGLPCFTVHPLGNLGGAADVGGRPRTVVPAAPRLMTDALRRLDAGRATTGLRATFEATHHGPVTAVPAFFAEIGYGADAAPSPAAVGHLARVLQELEEAPDDRIVLGVGGGHYAPHFTDLALKRRWAFGHLVPRHALLLLDRATAHQVREATPGAEGALYARSADLGLPAAAAFQPRLSEGAAPRRSGDRTAP